MKGILLAGGSGTRLHPVTEVVNKHLLPIYHKPMVYYPLSTLMLAGIQEVLVISTPEDTPLFEELLGDGASLGLSIEYEVQPEPNGIAEAFLIGRDFIGDDDVTLILGDNIFYGHDLAGIITQAIQDNTGATLFGYTVKDPHRYGVVEFDSEGRVVGLEEKPDDPKSHHAVTGLYVYDSDVVGFAADLEPSDRGELEITAVNRAYLEQGRLRMQDMGRGIAWLDTGTPEALIEASHFIATIERRQGLRVACLEEVAYRKGFISLEELESLAASTARETDRQYLERIVAEEQGRRITED